MSHKNGSFSSSLGFVLACVGSGRWAWEMIVDVPIPSWGNTEVPAFLVPYIFF